MTGRALKNGRNSGISRLACRRPRVPVVLASGSARRREMLKFLGIPFTACAPRTQEKWRSRHKAEDVAVRLAREKVRACGSRRTLVIAMDTVVVLGGRILGKPATEPEARAMLKRLSGRSHRVVTGVALSHLGKVASGSETTRVRFRVLKDSEIDRYVKSGEPFDKAGGYGIQGFARVFVGRIEGCFYNVVGFPLALFQNLLANLNLSIYDLMD
jgi:septum formation protein